jgi:hypothetical protein
MKPKVALLAVMALVLPLPSRAQTPPDAFDGSFLLETGEIVTGGYFVEGGQGLFLYINTESVERGGLFERVDDTTLRAVTSPDLELRFGTAADGMLSLIEWKEGNAAFVGSRVLPHTSTTVAFSSDDGTLLHGRILAPMCPGPHPTVVAVHGSGPVDRHGGTYHTFFLRHGIAVLAYDKRGYTSDPDAWREPDLATLSADAAAALRYAARRPEVDADRIGFFGSSQAGWVVPRAAVEATETDFMILRAGAATRNLDTILHEVRQDLRLEGLEGLDLDYAIDLRDEIYRIAAEGGSLTDAEALADTYREETWYVAAIGEGSVTDRWSPESWARLSRNLDVTPARWIERFDRPVLWFLAELDENVPLVPSRAELERAFGAAPSSDHEIVVVEGALHSFLVPSPDGAVRFTDEFFSRMQVWLAERGLTGAGCPQP